MISASLTESAFRLCCADASPVTGGGVSALLPLGFPRGVEIKIHPPVETEGRTEEEVEADVFEAINSGLPAFQVSSALRSVERN